MSAGIISVSELEAMCSSGALLKSITRENLSMYLVRAMQQEPMAQNLTSYSMSFADTASISQVLRPYVYLLNTYGIVQGNDDSDPHAVFPLAARGLSDLGVAFLELREPQGRSSFNPTATTPVSVLSRFTA